MHGRAINKNTSANCHTGSDGAANTPITATAIIHTFGFTTCSDAALRASKGLAALTSRGCPALRKMRHASQLNHSTPVQLITCWASG
ncbi:hypothetical protein D3C73_1368500 [compost metagenome]